MKLFAVIPTVGERNETLFPMCEQLEKDGVQVIVVHNCREAADGTEPPSLNVPFTTNAPALHTHYWAPDEPVNLSAIWNMGLDWAHDLADGEEYVVAVLNDDLTLPPDLVKNLAWYIENNNTAAAFAADPAYERPFKVLPGDPVIPQTRMCGFAFALLGSRNLRADEHFLWWWGDTDLDLRARMAGGVLGVPLQGLVHHDPNGYTNRTPAFTEQAGRDRETFIAKWGGTPW